MCSLMLVACKNEYQRSVDRGKGYVGQGSSAYSMASDGAAVQVSRCIRAAKFFKRGRCESAANSVVRCRGQNISKVATKDIAHPGVKYNLTFSSSVTSTRIQCICSSET